MVQKRTPALERVKGNTEIYYFTSLFMNKNTLKFCEFEHENDCINVSESSKNKIKIKKHNLILCVHDVWKVVINLCDVFS